MAIFSAQTTSIWMKILIWLTDKVIGGVLTGVIGLVVALMIYRLLFYWLVDREKIKKHILEYIKLCNGKWEKDSWWHMNTPDDPDGKSVTKPFFPTTKAVMQWVRHTDKLFKFTRWGLKYDEEYFETLLEDMSAEGRVTTIKDPKTGETIGWKHCSDEI